METITNFPHSFRMHGETIELEKNTLRRIDNNGVEGRMSLVGDVIAAASSEPVDEWAVAVQYKEGVYVISKKHGWFGPFEKVEDISFDDAKGVSIVQGVLDGKAGNHRLEK